MSCRGPDIGPLNRKRPGMNKTEPVREREERQDLGSFAVSQFGSLEVTNCESPEVTNCGSDSRSELLAGAVQNFRTLGGCDFHTVGLRKSETSALPKGASS